MGFNTELLHGTKTGDPVTGATLTPVYQSSAFFQPSAEQHEKLFHNKAALIRELVTRRSRRSRSA